MTFGGWANFTVYLFGMVTAGAMIWAIIAERNKLARWLLILFIVGPSTLAMALGVDISPHDW